MEDFVVKALFSLTSAILLTRFALRAIGVRRFLWFFITLAPLWHFIIYMGVLMGAVPVFKYIDYLEPVSLLLFTAPVISAYLAGGA